MKKVIYISGTRADYLLMRNALMGLDKQVALTVIATFMHLSPKFGSTVKEIKKDGLKIKKIKTLTDDDSLGAMIKSFGVGVCGIGEAIKEISPDVIFVEADRGEALIGAIVGAHLNIPVVHHGGGDVTGSIDNKIRYAVTMFADYHLVGNSESYQRLLDIGIAKNKIFKVGEPGLDDIYAREFTPKDEMLKKYKIDPKKPFILLVQHPNTEEYDDTKRQIKETLDAIKKLKIQTIAIYSNADAGGRIINKILEEYAKKLSFLKVYPHVEKRDFLGLMNACGVMIGNSSAGIVELPSFKKPFVCIGTREGKRLRGGNTMDVDYKKKEIVEATNKALYGEKFKKKLENIKNPYGGGKSSAKIVEIISKKIK